MKQISRGLFQIFYVGNFRYFGEVSDRHIIIHWLFFDKTGIFGILALFFFIMVYPPNEIVDMIRILGEARNNYSTAERLYPERFPDAILIEKY